VCTSKARQESFPLFIIWRCQSQAWVNKEGDANDLCDHAKSLVAVSDTWPANNNSTVQSKYRPHACIGLVFWENFLPQGKAATVYYLGIARTQRRCNSTQFHTRDQLIITVQSKYRPHAYIGLVFWEAVAGRPCTRLQCDLPPAALGYRAQRQGWCHFTAHWSISYAGRAQRSQPPSRVLLDKLFKVGHQLHSVRSDDCSSILY